MKYLSQKQILESLFYLREHHPWFGYTYLAAKRERLPVGSTMNVSLDAITRRFLVDYYSLHPKSKKFFRPLRHNNYDQHWVNADYASSGLQKANTTTFGDAFIHPLGSRQWGWRNGYVDTLAGLLPRRIKLPAFHLAVWLYRRQQWDDADERQSIVQRFLSDFEITEEEQQKLFDLPLNSNLSEDDAFQELPVPFDEIIAAFSKPDDVEPEEGGILTFLSIDGVGPVSPLVFEPARRLNIITGDNGLGKSFLLEVSWYALTGQWAEHEALPNLSPDRKQRGSIKFQITGRTSTAPQSTSFDVPRRSWKPIRDRETIAGLVVYARVDGSYAVWDPVEFSHEEPSHTMLVLDRSHVWNGTSDNRIQGLIRDWVRWQDNPKRFPFNTFLQVLRCMAPPDIKDLAPGDYVRLPRDSRDYPTIRHEYGDVPILHESAGIKHVITLAYLMVWSWHEHVIKADAIGRRPENRMVVIVDEMEVHLHPKWQRVILPALLRVARILSSAPLEMQLIIATHSPLVLASAEPVFNNTTDKLFHLNQLKSGAVEFIDLPFMKYGEVSSWLTSDVFEMKQARSKEAELAITEAIELQLQEEPSVEDIRKVSERLIALLPAEDQFWPRWVFFAERHGVKI